MHSSRMLLPAAAAPALSPAAVATLERVARPALSLAVIQVATPCHADWETMIGDARARFCGECKKNVYNLSALTTPEAEALLKEKEGNLCVRYFQRADGTILTQDCPVGVRAKIKRQLTRALARIAAVGVLTLSFFGCKARSGGNNTGVLGIGSSLSAFAANGFRLPPPPVMGSPAPLPLAPSPANGNANLVNGVGTTTTMPANPAPAPGPQGCVVMGEAVAPEPRQVIMGKIAPPAMVARPLPHTPLPVQPQSTDDWGF